MGFKRPEVQIFSLRPKNSRMQLRLFLFCLSEKFSFRRLERTRFPYFIFTRLYFRFSLLLTRFCRGAKRYSVAAFILRSYLLSRNSRRSLQIFSLKPKNSRMQLRLFLFRLSEKFPFRRPERTRFPYFIFTRRYFRFSLLLTRSYRGAKRYSVAAFLFYGLIYSLVKVAAPYKSSHSDQKNSRKRLRLFLFSLSEKFSFRRPKRTRFPYIIFTRRYFRLSLLLIRFCRGAKRYSVAAFYFTVLFIIS